MSSCRWDTHSAVSLFAGRMSFKKNKTRAMPLYIRVPIALDLVLLGTEHLLPISHGVLPLGGSHLIQLAILLVFGIGLQELRRDPPGGDSGGEVV